MTVDECGASIMWYEENREEMFLDQLYKASVVQDSKYDAEMVLLSNLVSVHACELIYTQCIYATMRARYTVYEPVPDV